MRKNRYTIPIRLKKVMQYTTLIAIMLTLFATAGIAKNAHAQDVLENRLTISVQQAPLREAINKIGAQCNCQFMYAKDLLPLKTKVTINAQNRTLRSVLDELLKPFNVSYKSSEAYIFIKEKPRMGGIDKPVQQPVTGQITDAQTGEALPGVTVSIKGTTTGVTADSAGFYRLEVADGEAVLLFLAIGYEPQELRVGTQTVVNARLSPSAQSLNQVVVVGYGAQGRKSITGAVAVVTGKQVREVPVAGIDQALQGRVAGVQVTQTSGQPGGGVAVRIRGTSSITAGNEPLYVIDGVPFYNWNTSFNQGPAGIQGTGQVSNTLSAINPNDIESITVLKDASAAAIYGSRAANGVVLITTRRGKAGKARIEFDAYAGTQQLAKKMELLNAAEFRQFNADAVAGGNADLNPPAANLLMPDYGADTDWQGQVFQDAPIQNYQLSITGGNEQTQYAIAGGFFDQQGIVKVSGYRRYSGRINLDQKVDNRFKIGASVVINNADNTINRAFGNVSQGGVIYGALMQLPSLPVFDADGNYDRPDYTITRVPQIDNPLSSAEEYWHPINTTRLISSAYGEYKLWPRLTFRSSIAFDANYLKNNIFIPIGVGDPRPASLPQTGAGFAFASQELTWINENTLTWDKTWRNKHKMTAVGGFNVQEAAFERMISRVFNFPNNLVQTTNGGQTDLTNSFREEWKMLSFLGRVNYEFKGKYLFTAALRADGSSRFGPGRRFGYFPAVSAGWRIAEEAFMEKAEWVNDLKLRVSYGATGNAEIVNTVNSFANYPYLGSITPANYAFGGQRGVVNNGLAPGSLSNDDLSWETTTQFDLGVDLSVFNGRLNVTADYYNKQTSDILLRNNPIPHTTGFSNFFANVGSMENRGVELAVSTLNFDKAFQWKTEGNIAFNRNKLLDLGPNLRFIPSGNSITRVGEPIGSFFGLQVESIFQNQQEIESAPEQNGRGSRARTRPGDIRFRDTDGNGVIDANDRVLLGNPQPDFIYGLTNTFGFKGFELTIFLQGVQGNEVFNATRNTTASLNGNHNNLREAVNRWRSPEQPGDGRTPRAVNNDPNNNSRFSDRWVEDGSFLRVRNLTLGYTLPTRWTERARIQKLRVYGSVQNLFTFTKYSGYDPEFNRNPSGQPDPLNFGTDDSNYPVPRTILFGLTVQL